MEGRHVVKGRCMIALFMTTRNSDLGSGGGGGGGDNSVEETPRLFVVTILQ